MLGKPGNSSLMPGTDIVKIEPTPVSCLLTHNNFLKREKLLKSILKNFTMSQGQMGLPLGGKETVFDIHIGP